MKTTILGLCLALLAASAIAQKPPIKFGDIPMEDLKMSVYEKDSSASALVLADYGESELIYNSEKGFMLSFERIRRIKILKKEGLEWGNFSFGLYHSSNGEEKATILKGTTYNLESGKVVESKLKNEGIFKEKDSENWDVMKITMPNVKEGSVVEVTYKIVSDFVYNFQDWEFQSTIPVRWSEYRARIPEYYHFEKFMQGYVALNTAEATSVPSSITITSKERSEGYVTKTQFYSDKIDFKENRYRWAASDVPAFKEEPFMTTYRDYISKINFELAYTQFPNSPIKHYSTTWEDVNRQYAEDEKFGMQVSGNGFLKKVAEEATAGMTTPEAKVAALDRYVKNNFSWDGQTRTFFSGSLRSVMDDKKGNSAALNLLLASLIEKTGIEVHPVLISTRDHGFLREQFPQANQFNSVVVVATFDNKSVLLDATEKLLPTGFLPERCLNGKGMVVSKSGPKWIDLRAPSKSRKSITVDLAMNPDGEFIGKVSADRSGYYGLKSRKAYLSKGEADYVKEYLNDDWQIGERQFQNTNELSASFKESYQVTINDHATVSGNTIYFNPLFQWQMQENPFKLEKREYPVDFGSPFDEMCMVRLHLPAGYTLDEAPESKILMLPENAGKLMYNVSVAQNTISITSSLQINRSIFTQVEYENLREFYNRVVSKHAEQIVLKKN